MADPILKVACGCVIAEGLYAFGLAVAGIYDTAAMTLIGGIQAVALLIAFWRWFVA